MLPLHRILCRLPLLLALCTPSRLHAEVNPDWTAPQKPFQIAANLFYVGSRDLAAYLITTPAGNILLNGNLENSPPQIRAAVEDLGFRWSDTRILLNSQAHFDHAAGNAAIVRETHAKLMVMDADASVIETGGRTDFAHLQRFPPTPVSRVLHDGEQVSLGGVILTAHKTAGHTRGCTTWTMDVQDAKGHLQHVVILGGFTVLDDYHLVTTPGHPASYPGIADDFTRGFALLHTLPCDIVLGAHGSYFGMEEKLRRLPTVGPAVWNDPQGCRQIIDHAQLAFETRLDAERRKAR